MYQIQKNVPLPAPERSGLMPKYPFAKMLTIGDMFEVPVSEGETTGQVRVRLLSAARDYRDRSASTARFASRVLNDGRTIGLWRVA